MKKAIFLLTLGLMLLASVSLFAQDTDTLAGNLVDECVTDFDPNTDYFPDKADVRHAENFTVEYFNHYKVVTVSDAFDGADPFQYVLVQCGTPTPPPDAFADNAQFIEVPSGNIITMSTTQLPHLKDLGLLDNLIGLDSFLYTNTPEVRTMIEAGEVIEVGSGSTVNIELILDAETDLVMTYGFDPANDAFPILIDAGIFTAINAEWREATPLARAEWNKYIALFYNAEARAEAVFNDIESAYNDVRDLAATVPEDDKPDVLVNVISVYSEAWIIPGADTYIGLLVEAAGGTVALGEEAPSDSAFLSFETVYEGALEADIWLVELFGLNSLDDLITQDERFADFLAVQNSTVWNNNLDENDNGGNNYFELGVTNPHLILQDLVAIFHPELLPDHDFNFYQKLQ